MFVNKANIRRPTQVLTKCMQAFLQRVWMNKPIRSGASNESTLPSYEIYSGKFMKINDPKLTITTNNDIMSESSINANRERLAENTKSWRFRSEAVFLVPSLFLFVNNFCCIMFSI